MFVRAYAFIRMWGPGLREMSETAVLNANYLLARLRDAYELPYDRRCMHEFVLSARNLKREHGVTALDVAKRLIDHGFHPPTVYFPLIVPEAMMIEPTETEAVRRSTSSARRCWRSPARRRDDPQQLKDAPHSRPVSRPDEALAAKRLVVRHEFDPTAEVALDAVLFDYGDTLFAFRYEERTHEGAVRALLDALAVDADPQLFVDGFWRHFDAVRSELPENAEVALPGADGRGAGGGRRRHRWPGAVRGAARRAPLLGAGSRAAPAVRRAAGDAARRRPADRPRLERVRPRRVHA